MGYKLRKREFDYCSPQFTRLRISDRSISKGGVVGGNYLQVLKLIEEQYKKLALEFHPDKTTEQIEALRAQGGSEEEIKALKDLITERMQAINGHKAELLKCIRPLRSGDNLIVHREFQRYMQLIKQEQIDLSDKRTKYFFIFGVSLLLLLTPYIYLGVRLFIAANFTTIPGILFSATLLTFATKFLLTRYVFSPVNKKVGDLKDKLQKLGKNLTQEQIEEIEKDIEDIEDTRHKIMSERKFLIFASQCMPYLSCALLVAGLGLQYQSGCMDSKVLIGLVAVFGCTLMMKLAFAIYEREVAEVVKTEGMSTEQRAPLAILDKEPPSSNVDHGSGVLNASEAQSTGVS